jgi:hypothetical protein
LANVSRSWPVANSVNAAEAPSHGQAADTGHHSADRAGTRSSVLRTDWKRAGVTSETVIDMIEKGLIVDHPLDRLALTMRGRAVLKDHGAALREVTGRSLSALMFRL